MKDVSLTQTSDLRFHAPKHCLHICDKLKTLIETLNKTSLIERLTKTD